MVKEKIPISLAGMIRLMEGLKCPECETAYLAEQVALRVVKAEEELGVRRIRGEGRIQWKCFKCKEKMAEKDITVSFMEIIRFVRGLQCPKCGFAYIPEETATEVIIKGEEEIEAKLG